MKDLLEIMGMITELLYQERSSEAYGILVKCLPHMATVLESLEDNALQNEILDSLQEAIVAMENNDFTLLADILNYDVIARLEGIGEE